MGTEKRKSTRTYSDKFLIKRLVKYLLVHKKMMVVALLMMIIQTVIFALGPYLTKTILDNYLIQNKENDFFLF